MYRITVGLHRPASHWRPVRDWFLSKSLLHHKFLLISSFLLFASAFTYFRPCLVTFLLHFCLTSLFTKIPQVFLSVPISVLHRFPLCRLHSLFLLCSSAFFPFCLESFLSLPPFLTTSPSLRLSAGCINRSPNKVLINLWWLNQRRHICIARKEERRGKRDDRKRRNVEMRKWDREGHQTHV